MTWAITKLVVSAPVRTLTQDPWTQRAFSEGAAALKEIIRANSAEISISRRRRCRWAGGGSIINGLSWPLKRLILFKRHVSGMALDDGAHGALKGRRFGFTAVKDAASQATCKSPYASTIRQAMPTVLSR